MRCSIVVILVAACGGSQPRAAAKVGANCTDIAACSSLCTAHDGFACGRLGKFYEKATPPDRGAARRAYAQGCDLRVGDVCTVAAQLELELGDSKHATQLADRACKLDSLEGCVTGGVIALVDDVPHALALFQHACDGKNLDGCANLGAMYMQGLGVPADPARAIPMLEPACSDGFYDACGNLGLAYGLGLGVTIDHAKSIQLLDTACTNGKTLHCTGLAMMLARGDAAEQTRVEPLLTKLCDANEMMSCANLATLYINGTVVAKNADRAARLFEKACPRAPSACGGLGSIYLNGDGRPVDLNKGLELELRACDGGFMQGCAYAGIVLTRGGDASRGDELLHKACDAGERAGCDALPANH
jgi:TPR repeat protein